MTEDEEQMVKELRKMAQKFEGMAHEAGELDASLHWSKYARWSNEAADYVETVANADFRDAQEN